MNKFIEVRVHKSYVSKSNKAVKLRNFFGQDQYTSDSDVVCILQHTGQLKVRDEEPFDTDHEAFSVVFKVLKGRSTYPSAIRHHIKSRKQSSYEGHSLKLEGYARLEFIGTEDELLNMAQKMPTMVDKHNSNKAMKHH